jgi:hypothetical protein
MYTYIRVQRKPRLRDFSRFIEWSLTAAPALAGVARTAGAAAGEAPGSATSSERARSERPLDEAAGNAGAAATPHSTTKQEAGKAGEGMKEGEKGGGEAGGGGGGGHALQRDEVGGGRVRVGEADAWGSAMLAKLGTDFICFTRTEVQVLTQKALLGTQFTCFTGAKYEH